MLKVGIFNVRIVATGDRYGRNDCFENDGPPLVEFYDSRFDFFPGRGQFVSRYGVDTILSFKSGLWLDCGSEEWVVSPEDMDLVKAYVTQFTGATAAA